MKGIYKRGLSFVLILLMVLSLFSGITVSSEAASVFYQTVDTEKYKGVVKNWGQRGEVSSFLSPMAEDFYDDLGVTYDDFAALSNDVQSGAYYASDLAETIRNLTLRALVKDPSYDDSRYLYQYTDIQRNGELTTAISSFYDGGFIGPVWDGNTWNREHIWPQSLGGPDDIIMLRPLDSKINSSRNNTGFGEGSNFYNPNKASNGAYDVRGDVARIALYVYVRYGESDQEIRTNLFGKTGEYGPEFESCAILLKWMEEDPVDTWEMGRNDSVQSITGTRNMFVDYPELAFMLFDAQIPAGYVTPSGEGYGDVDYTVTATSSNLDCGTVEVNGAFVTAIPAPGYALDSYVVTAGQASLSNDGNLIFVDAQGDCSVQVRFKKADKINVSFLENGVLKSVQTSEAGAIVRMPAKQESVGAQYTFLGWTPQHITDTLTAPSVIYAVGTDVTVYETTTFCAVYSWVSNDQQSSTTVWNLVTDNAQLAENKQLFITAANEDLALSTTQNKNNRGQTAIAKNTEAKTATPSADTEILTLSKGSLSGTYALKASDGRYLFAKGSNSDNFLRSQVDVDEYASWKISVDASGNASVVAQGANTNVIMRYNTSSNLFSCYKSEQQSRQQDISLYVATQQSVATHYTTDIRGLDCDHDAVIAVVVNPTCLIRGYSAMQCDDCDAVTQVTNFVSCASHSWTQWTAADADGEQSRKCTYCGYAQNTVVPQQTADPFHSYNLALGDDIAMNILLELTDAQASEGTACVTVNDVTTDYDLMDLPVVDGKYKLTIHLAAAQMTDAVEVELLLADGRTEKAYSVAEYASYILKDTTGTYNQKTKDLVLAMLHYGAAAQKYFNYNAGNPANDGWTDTVTNIPVKMQYSAVQNAVDGIAHYGATLLHRENIATRFYFVLTGNKTIDAFTVKCGNSSLKINPKDGLYYVEIDGILPQDLDREVTVTVNGTMQISYSPLNYIYNVYNNTQSPDSLKALVQQLYDYHLAAKAYTAQ